MSAHLGFDVERALDEGLEPWQEDRVESFYDSYIQYIPDEQARTLDFVIDSDYSELLTGDMGISNDPDNVRGMYPDWESAINDLMDAGLYDPETGDLSDLVYLYVDEDGNIQLYIGYED